MKRTYLMSKAEEEFLKAMREYIPPMVKPDEYRAYYDENGWIIFFAANQFPPEGNWINIDKDLYITHNWTNLKVIDNAIKKVEIDTSFRVQLIKSDHGFRTVQNHAGLILEEDEEYSDVDYYDIRKNI